MPDGNARRRGDEELPPDPWAGLADAVPPPPPPPPPGAEAAWRDHPSVGAGDGGGPEPPSRRTLWHHPAVWVLVLLLAGVLLIGALLEPAGRTPTEPSPGTVTAGVWPAAGG